MGKKKLFHIQGNLPVTILQESDKYIAYTPALDLSTFGSTSEEARSRFEELLDIFFEELVEMGTLEEVLQTCGWKKVTEPEACWIPPRVVEQTTKNIDIKCRV